MSSYKRAAVQGATQLAGLVDRSTNGAPRRCRPSRASRPGPRQSRPSKRTMSRSVFPCARSSGCDVPILSRLDTEPRPAPLETWISVDVETSGPTPGVASLLSIGARCCGVRTRRSRSSSGRSRNRLGHDRAGRPRPDPRPPRRARPRAARGHDAVRRLDRCAPHGRRRRPPGLRRLQRPVRLDVRGRLFLAITGANPFGVSALDIKSLYLGRAWPEVSAWADTTRTKILARHPRLTGDPLSHDALDDARQQAELLERLLDAAVPSDG